MATLRLISNGLLFRDDFNRPNNFVVGNGWTEFESDPEGMKIDVNQLTCIITGRQDVTRAISGLPNDIIAQSNHTRAGATIGGGTLLLRSSATAAFPSGDQYGIQLENTGQDSIGVFKVLAGVIVQSDFLNIAFGATAHFGIRLVLEVSGTDLLVRGYRTGTLASSEDLAKDFVLEVNITDTTPIANDAAHDDVDIGMLDFGRHDAYILTGRNVKVSGLPTGWKVELDDRTPRVVEVGGVATVNMDTFNQPFAKLELFDNLDVLQDTFTGVFYGGSTFDLGVPIDPTLLTCVCVVDELAIDLTWIDNSVDETGFRIERGDALTGPFVTVGIVSPNTVTFRDLTVTESKQFFYRVFAFNTFGDSGPTNVASCTSRLYSECLLAPATKFTKVLNPTTTFAKVLNPVTTFTKVPNDPLCS